MAHDSVGLSGWFAVVRDSMRSKLWPLPCLGVAVALLAGVLLPRFDDAILSAMPAGLSGLLFGGSPSAARTFLDAVASSLITVTSLTFSLTVVTLQLASSQFSPRLLRTFTRDIFVQATLALFLATFTYALTVLRTVRDGGEGETPFVPRVSVTFGFLLAVTSVIGLVLFLAHLARQIRPETLLRSVYAESREAVARLLASTSDEVDDIESSAPPDGASMLVCAASSGFLTRVDEAKLLSAATKADAVVVIELRPGEATTAGVPVGTARQRSGRRLDHEAEARLSEAIQGALHLAFERTEVQDIGFGLRQLTDVALKALSPSTNDPTTAVHALGYSSALLCDIARRGPGRRVLRDDSGNVRVIQARPDLADLLELVVAQPRRYGAADPIVMARLLSVLRELAWFTPTAQHHVITDQLERLRITIQNQDFDSAEHHRLAVLATLVEAAMEGRWGSD